MCNFSHLKSVQEMSDIRKKIDNVIVNVPLQRLDGTETLKCSNLRCVGFIRTPLVSVYPNVARAAVMLEKDKILFCSVACFDVWVTLTKVNNWDEYVKKIEPE